MDTGGKKDLCLFWEWVYEYFRRSGQKYHFTNMGAYLKTQEVSIPSLNLFLKNDSSGFIMVCHIEG